MVLTKDSRIRSSNIPVKMEDKEEGERAGTRVYEEDGLDTTWEGYNEEEGERRQGLLVHGEEWKRAVEMVVDGGEEGEKRRESVPNEREWREEGVIYEGPKGQRRGKSMLDDRVEGKRRQERILHDWDELERMEEYAVYEEDINMGAVKHEEEDGEREQGTRVNEEEQETRVGTVVFEEDGTEMRMRQDWEVMQGQLQEGMEDGSRDHVICIEKDMHITMAQVPSFPEWWLRLSSTFLSFLSSSHLVDLWLICRDGSSVPAHQLLLSHASPTLAGRGQGGHAGGLRHSVAP